MYHYSYTFPDQVYKKTAYYKTFVSGGTIPDYFVNVFLHWVTSNEEDRLSIERQYKGVHEWIPERRGECYTAKFRLQHPESIEQSMNALSSKFHTQLLKYFRK